MYSNKLTADEARRNAQHRAVRERVESSVNADLAGNLNYATADEQAKLENVASRMRSKTIDEVADREREVERARWVARVSQVIDFIFYFIYATLALRLVLGLIGARSSAMFVQFIRDITDPFYAPFRGIVDSPAIEGGMTLAMPIVVALLVYAVLHAVINRFLRLFVENKTEV